MAIDDLLDEHEQSERARTWLRNNAFGLVSGVALGLAAIFGWQWWQGQQVQGQYAASDRYAALQEQLRAGKVKEAQAAAKELAGTPFEVTAALAIAKAQLDSGKRDDAIATLRAAKDADSLLAPVVTQRLARLLIDAGKASEALPLVGDADEPAVQEIRGDALFALGRLEEARKAYDKALVNLQVGTPQRLVVELKLTQAGGTPPQTPDRAS